MLWHDNIPRDSHVLGEKIVSGICSFKNNIRGLREASVGTGACHQDWGLEFEP